LQQPPALQMRLTTAETTKHTRARKIIILSLAGVTSNAAAKSNNIPAPHKTDRKVFIALLSILSSFFGYLDNTGAIPLSAGCLCNYYTPPETSFPALGFFDSSARLAAISLLNEAQDALSAAVRPE